MSRLSHAELAWRCCEIDRANRVVIIAYLVRLDLRIGGRWIVRSRHRELIGRLRFVDWSPTPDGREPTLAQMLERHPRADAARFVSVRTGLTVSMLARPRGLVEGVQR